MKKLMTISLASSLLISCGPPSIDKLPKSAPAGMDKVQYEGINFGIDYNDFSNDSECDDPRFEGSDVSPILFADDAYTDATDCLNAYKRGAAKLRAGASKT